MASASLANRPNHPALLCALWWVFPVSGAKSCSGSVLLAFQYQVCGMFSRRKTDLVEDEAHLGAREATVVSPVDLFHVMLGHADDLGGANRVIIRLAELTRRPRRHRHRHRHVRLHRRQLRHPPGAGQGRAGGPPLV